MSQPTKTLLLAVTGATPQVITETLYGIYKQGLEWPQKIEILTTSFGKEQARLNLITDGKLQALCDEYNLELPEFSESLIHVIPDAAGNEVADARTLEDQEALADFIVKTIANRSLDNDVRIHASIAGGRKTMTFFLGYAMSIFGRDFDRLSHVLVSEQFESNPQFYYPTLQSKTIDGRDNIRLDCSKAEVMLAEIPLISQRMLNPKLVAEFEQFSYNEIVNAIQLAQRPEHVQLTLNFDKANPQVTFGHKTIEFGNRKADFALLAAFARAKKHNEPGFYRQTYRNETADFTLAILQELCTLEGIRFDSENLIDALEELEFQGSLDGKTVDALKRVSDHRFDENNFSDRRTSLQKYLSKHLPKAAVNLLVPQTKGQNNPYQLPIMADMITFVGA
ncbi:CRISPR-associated ring nuclease Csm6 [Alkalimonas sp. MEB108]|uniref:CRISPR-associated ring nuclease Csm6 n=1 Tax=Alkalimonas cellulosilytica TaxID=3058395 RepID=A0ABU7JAJ1_9GAMM|nr:CRISPR-associated ring nuclease Csm6 [Alkalimonas sp. MEB108]MEE2003007.1 CRISPR-associated ring nuclease Csm6 [Alkalimonas sp. MEB108]